MSDDVTLSNVTMIQATGQKATMPEVAPDGQLLVARTPGQPTELWCGTGDSVEQISTGGGGGGANLPDQTGNANRFLMTDGENPHWSPVPMRNIGEIFASLVPLTDAGLHLLDGSLINGNGIYSDFVDYIAGIYDPTANYFCTEVEWQTAVTTYGVCGKFVYNSVNNTVRLPKITGIVEGTTDLSALGDLVEAGLPNITGTGASLSEKVAATGALQKGSLISSNYYNNEGSLSKIQQYKFSFDASRSSAIYDNSNTVQPQTIKVLYYIVIATSTKTDIQVDIDEIATDLNGKADTDLANVNNSGKAKVAGWAMPSSTYKDLTLGASGSSYTAPANGYILFNKNVSGTQYVSMTNLTSHIGIRCLSNEGNAGCYMPVLKGEQFQVWYTASGTVNCFRFVYAQGSESEAS